MTPLPLHQPVRRAGARFDDIDRADAPLDSRPVTDLRSARAQRPAAAR